MKKCPVSGKRCYRSKGAARLATRNVHNRFRVYICPDCGCFHVTSKVG